MPTQEEIHAILREFRRVHGALLDVIELLKDSDLTDALGLDQERQLLAARQFAIDVRAHIELCQRALSDKV